MGVAFILWLPNEQSKHMDLARTKFYYESHPICKKFTKNASSL